MLGHAVAVSATRPAGRTVGWAFLAVGLGLLAGAAYAWHAMVTRPLSWPRVQADVVSSRVVNPRKPSQLQAEIVLDVRDGIGLRRVTIVPSWSSSSYGAVRAYVDGYPAGARIDVAVNPADRDDVRFELGATWTNLLLPGILGVIGAVFALVGAVVRLRPAEATAREPSARTRVRVGRAFAAIAVGACGLGAWLWSLGTPLDWPEVDASVVEGRVIEVRSSRSSTPPRARYDIQITFAFDAGARRITTTTASGHSSSTRDDAEERLQAYAPGTRHRIRRQPDDPNVIRFEVSAIRERMLPIAMVGMGLIFGLFALWLNPCSEHAPSRLRARSRARKRP